MNDKEPTNKIQAWNQIFGRNDIRCGKINMNDSDIYDRFCLCLSSYVKGSGKGYKFIVGYALDRILEKFQIEVSNPNYPKDIEWKADTTAEPYTLVIVVKEDYVEKTGDVKDMDFRQYDETLYFTIDNANIKESQIAIVDEIKDIINRQTYDIKRLYDIHMGKCLYKAWTEITNKQYYDHEIGIMGIYRSDNIADWSMSIRRIATVKSKVDDFPEEITDNLSISKEEAEQHAIHPEHYSRLIPEPKDVIRAWKLNFNLGSAVKYISRAGHKDDIVQDLEKAKKFLDFEIEAIKKERGEL